MLSASMLAQSFAQIANEKDNLRSQLAAVKWAQAYDSYARQAQDASSDLVLSTNLPGLIAALNFDGSRSAAELAQQFETGFVAYWTGAVFSVGIPPPPVSPNGCANVGGNSIFATEIASLVVAVTPGVMLSQLLPELMVVLKDETIESRSNAIAQAMHRATTTAVMVLITGIDTTPPPAGPLPVTNICTIT
jgi:hypothetical protein